MIQGRWIACIHIEEHDSVMIWTWDEYLYHTTNFTAAKQMIPLRITIWSTAPQPIAINCSASIIDPCVIRLQVYCLPLFAVGVDLIEWGGDGMPRKPGHVRPGLLTRDLK